MSAKDSIGESRQRRPQRNGAAPKPLYIALCVPVGTDGACNSPQHLDPTGVCRAASGAKPAAGKRPIGSAWAEHGTVERPEGNAGVLCGPRTGLLVIDVDTDEAAKQYEAWQLPATRTVLSGRGEPGRHYYFRWPTGLKRVPNRLDGVEVKGDGRQVVAAGSLHQSGRLYELLSDTEPAELPAAFVERLTASTAQRDRVQGGEATPEAAELLDRWLQMFPEAEQQADGDWLMLCPHHGDHNPSLLVTAKADKLVLHCRSHGCAAGDIAAAKGWTLSELWVRPEAAPFDPSELTWRRVEGSLDHYEWAEDEDGDPVLVEMPQAAPYWSVREWNGADLAAAKLPPVETLPLLGQRGYIGKGLSNLIAAFPKVGKTTLMEAFLRETLGAGETVLYFTEEPAGLWGPRLTGDPSQWAGLNLVLAMGLPVPLLLDRVRTGDETIVVIDTLRSVIGWDNENDNAQIAAAVTPWIVACRDSNKTLIGLHHSTKAGGNYGKGISGGHALFGAFDQAVEVERHGADNQRRVRTFGRIGAHPDMLYEMDDDGRLRIATGPLRTTAEDDGRRLIVECGAHPGTPVPGREDVKKLLSGAGTERAKAALKWLADNGWLEERAGLPSVWLERP